MLGLYRDYGKENGLYYNLIGYVTGLYRDNGKEDGSYYLGFSHNSVLSGCSSSKITQGF